MPITSLRKNFLTKPVFNLAKGALPDLSDTEREALEAGEVWWDAELFSGNPTWSVLMQTPAPRLSKEEQDFLNGPVNELCQMLNDWQVNWELKDLPPDVWNFIKQHKFFAMIIPKKYGGLEFSAYAHSEIIRKIASRSIVASVTIMVPNSLGPGELLIQFGTEQQRQYWLPRLADGTEIPCFGLTSVEAGSDAAAMVDHGKVCRGIYSGEDVLGIQLNWHKRYTTLGPVATVLGLAFKLYDPDHLLGHKEDLGITVALVPTHLAGIEIGRRHIPAYQMFQNGPSEGVDVFIPLANIIGGEKQIGKGWKILMTALSAGRGISLPSLSAATTVLSARVTGMYAQVRKQFNVPIGKFEGINELLGRMAASAYLLDAARRLTCASLDAGHKPAVISAIMKTHATYRMRESVNDAMDIHGGKTVMDGPSNYLGSLYRAVPISITVEGANVVTRNLIIFGQGAIRCHPWLLKEMLALEEKDPEKALQDFDNAFWGHIAHGFKTLGRAWVRNWTNGLISTAPDNVPDSVRPYYKQLARYSSTLALISEAALLTLGKKLKRREMISARLGDILSELYFISTVLKRWQDDGNKEADLPLVRYCMKSSFVIIEERCNAVLHNMPNRFVAGIARFIMQPFGACQRGPDDDLTKICAEILLKPSETRDRLTSGLCYGYNNDGVARLEKAFNLSIRSEYLRDEMKKMHMFTVDEAIQNGLFTSSEAELITETTKSIAAVLSVDDFSLEELHPFQSSVD